MNVNNIPGMNLSLHTIKCKEIQVTVILSLTEAH